MMQVLQTPAGRIAEGVVMPALCLDFDGTIRRSRAGKQFIEAPEDVLLFGDVEEKIWDFRDRDYLIFGISNQGSVAYGFKTPEQINDELDATLSAFDRNPFHIVKMCYHMEGGSVSPYNIRSLLRKPDYGMLAVCEIEAFDAGYIVDWGRSLFVGDREEDKECAKRAGIDFAYADYFFGR